MDTDRRLLIKWGMIAILQLIGAAYLFFDYIPAALVMSPYIYVMLVEKAGIEKKNIKRKISLQFKDAMTTITFSLNVGYSVENAFREAIKELEMLYGDDVIIVKEFKNIVRRVENNESIEKVFEEFALRSRVTEIIYFSQVFGYAKRSGGDLIAIIRNSVNTIREKIEVDEQIQTIISGKKMELKIMEIMPFAMIAYIRLTSEEFISPIYGNVTGVIIMLICLLAYVVAVYISKRIVEIDV